VKSYQIALRVAVVMVAIAAVLALVDGRPEDAIVPGLSAVGAGLVVYQMWRRPLPPPKVWTRRRTTIVVVVLAPVTVVVLGVLGWVAIKAAWPNRAVGLVGLLFVIAIVAWLAVTARREDRLARQAAGPGTPKA
jgi:hypothetical protein